MNDGRRAAVRNPVLPLLERGVVIISLDAEQIWGHLDLLDETEFRKRYPDVLEAYDGVLESLCSAGISATWFVVGGIALCGSDGAEDPRMAGLPPEWTLLVRAGSETTAPLWYHPAFLRHLREASVPQEIGLHGGLTHFIWTDPRATRETVKWELSEGIKALEKVFVEPRSFSFPRNQEAHHELLPAYGIRSYRGRARVLSEHFGRTLPGSVLRMLEELGRATPPPVWPEEALPGLWNIPASLFLYPIGPWRTKLVALRTRLERVSRGLDAAIRYRGIFHFCLHPANLAESPSGLSMFQGILDRLARARDRGDIEILTAAGVADRMQSLREKQSGPLPLESGVPCK